jgi:hypothetical protein
VPRPAGGDPSPLAQDISDRLFQLKGEDIANEQIYRRQAEAAGADPPWGKILEPIGLAR